MKTISINDTDKAVAQYLKDNKIQFFVSYLGAKKVWDNRQESDHWSVKFSMKKADHNGDLYASFDFYTGIGHRISHSKKIAYKLSTSQIESVKELRDLLGKDRLDNTVFKLKNNVDYAVSPTQASVLYCLLLDASGAEQNFSDWCGDFGYDNDSISAFKVYQACCDTLEKMRKIFSNSQRSELSELLQDY